MADNEISTGGGRFDVGYRIDESSEVAFVETHEHVPTVHIRNPPPSGWLKCRFCTRYITGGLLEEDGEIRDEEGNLVAQSRQLALVPR